MVRGDWCDNYDPIVNSSRSTLTGVWEVRARVNPNHIIGNSIYSFIDSLGTNVADILSAHPPSYLSGVVYITPVPYMGPVLQQVASPAALACLPRFLQTEDVTVFQETALQFLDLCSKSCPQPLRLACLGSIMVQPRAVTLRLLSRTQDETGLLKAGRESDLPLLIIEAKADAIIGGDEVRSAMDGWRNLKVVEIDGADHMPWVGHPDIVRQAILNWVKGTTALRQP